MATIDRDAHAAVVQLPPGPPLPRAVQGALALTNRRIALQVMRRVYGSAFTIDLPIFGRLVVLCDPNEIRQLFRTAPQLVDTTDANLDRLIDKALADPGLADRDDVLALMLQSRYEDGSAMTREEIADELITMLAAGHETTATTLAWAVERLQRHPQVLDRLVADLDAGSEELLNATIFE